MNSRAKIIVPIDTCDINKALQLVISLRDYVGMFKFGLELLNSMLVQAVLSEDNSVINKVRQLFKLTNDKLFWDGKWDDIPNTIKGVSNAVAPLRPAMVNIHASAGIESIKAAVENCPIITLVLGVTVLTSISTEECFSIFGDSSAAKVLDFADSIVTAGARGIICSPRELTILNQSRNTDLIKVTPGVRPVWADTGDQKRVMTPKEAVKAGADYLVIGRPITNPPPQIGSPVNAVQAIIEEIGG